MLEAELAAIHRQNDLYHDSLEQVNSWVKQYFVLNKPSVDIVLHSLEELQKISFQENTVSIAGSLEAIHEYLNPKELAL